MIIIRAPFFWVGDFIREPINNKRVKGTTGLLSNTTSQSLRSSGEALSKASPFLGLVWGGKKSCSFSNFSKGFIGAEGGIKIERLCSNLALSLLDGASHHILVLLDASGGVAQGKAILLHRLHHEAFVAEFIGPQKSVLFSVL